MSIDTYLLESALTEISDLCRKVGLEGEPLPKLDELAVEPPAGATLWTSTYAAVLFWPVSAADIEILRMAADQGQQYFDELITVRERSAHGRVIDGYLILGLPLVPADDVQSVIRQLELSSQVCRKHVVWPKPIVVSDSTANPSKWTRIPDVTVIGLPDADQAGVAEVYWPPLDDEAGELWRELESGNPVAIAQQHGGEIP